MERLAFLADEHVDRAYVAALPNAGYETAAVGAGYVAGIEDESLLRRCRKRGFVIVTNDRDFVRPGRSRDHAGIVVYTEQMVPSGRSSVHWCASTTTSRRGASGTRFSGPRSGRSRPTSAAPTVRRVVVQR